MADERFERFDKQQDRQSKPESEKKSKKIIFSMTEKRYEELARMQKFLGKKTLTSTIDYFIDQGLEKVREDFENIRER
ncbi:MAG: hypothetical protein PHD04_04510 [Candidatus Pacebacteria bacterium]|nr:hypothetical protein [Candidatus Paceibacterota bacterium]